MSAEGVAARGSKTSSDEMSRGGRDGESKHYKIHELKLTMPAGYYPLFLGELFAILKGKKKSSGTKKNVM